MSKSDNQTKQPGDAAETASKAASETPESAKKTSLKEIAKEFGGPKGPEPTRYGDWERKGIASDF